MTFNKFVTGSVVALVVLAGAGQLQFTNALSASALQQGIPSLAPMLKEVTPAVVSIRVSSSSVTNSRALQNNQLPDELRRFFGPEGAPSSPRGKAPERRRQGSGSGVIIDAGKGLIVTNHHVVDGAETITVSLKDGRNVDAELLGSDPGTDIALLRITADNLMALAFADSENAEIGDFVVAIGNPFGIGQTVTSGIISALGRAGLNSDKYEDFIQTDAAINVGNSGGALVDMEGNLMGINTAIISSNGGGSDGIGFAVPANMVAAVVEHLERDGEVQRGMLGVQISTVTPELANSLNLGEIAGALVTSVLPGSAAEAAGIKVYDVIVGIDGNPVASGRDLRNYVGLVRTGKTVELDVIRDSADLVINATLGGPEGVATAGTDPQNAQRNFAGATLRSGDLAGEDQAGVVITEVQPRSRAWQAGLRANDLITQVNRSPVTNLREFNSETSVAGDLLAFTVKREDRELVIVMS